MLIVASTEDAAMIAPAQHRPKIVYTQRSLANAPEHHAFQHSLTTYSKQSCCTDTASGTWHQDLSLQLNSTYLPSTMISITDRTCGTTVVSTALQINPICLPNTMTGVLIHGTIVVSVKPETAGLKLRPQSKEQSLQAKTYHNWRCCQSWPVADRS